MKKMLSLAVLLAVLALSGAQTPIPYRPPGFIYMVSDSRMAPVIELFYDHICPDSRDNWPTMKQVFDKFKGNITGIIHTFLLPWHHNTYFVQQAGVVIRYQGADFIQFMEMVFKEQDRFLTGAVNMTEPQVKQMIAQFAANINGITDQMIMDGFTDDKVVIEARYAWKYGCSRGVSGTPFFLINGVLDPNAGSYTVDDWTKMINKLMMGP